MPNDTPLVLDDGEHTWIVELRATVLLDGRACEGSCIPPTQNAPGRLVARCEDRTPYEIFTTLVGEALHAAEFAEEFAIPDASIHKAARYLCRLLRQNPALLGMIATATAKRRANGRKRGK